MKTFQEFILIAEATYDKDVMGSSQIRKQGEGGRVGANRKKSKPEIRRVRAVGGGKMEPVEYSPRKDIGQQRKREDREQQPQQERGSTEVRAKAAAAAKEERRKAAQARIAAKKKGESQEADKPKPKEAEKEASKLLSKKKEEKPTHPDYKPQKASGMTRAERDKARNQAKRELYNQRKAKLFADYKEVHGSLPTGKERTKLLALANKSL